MEIMGKTTGTGPKAEKVVDHKMNMTQFLELQRMREHANSPKKFKRISLLLNKAEVTNPIIVSISKQHGE